MWRSGLTNVSARCIRLKRIPQGSISENIPNMVGFGVEDGDVESLSCKMGTAPVLKRIWKKRSQLMKSEWPSSQTDDLQFLKGWKSLLWLYWRELKFLMQNICWLKSSSVLNENDIFCKSNSLKKKRNLEKIKIIENLRINRGQSDTRCKEGKSFFNFFCITATYNCCLAHWW